MTTLTNLAAFVTSNIVKAFQKRLMPAFVSRLAGIQLPSWIGTRFPRGSPESFERIEAWNNSRLKRFEKKEEEKLGKFGELVEESPSLREFSLEILKEKRFFFLFKRSGEIENLCNYSS